MSHRALPLTLVGSLASFLLVVSLASGTVAQKPPAPRGEVRVVDHHPVNWQTITVNVFEHLLLRQLERQISEQAHFLFLCAPITLWAVNRAVRCEPHGDPWVIGADLAVTDQHWSLRPGGAKP